MNENAKNLIIESVKDWTIEPPRKASMLLI